MAASTQWPRATHPPAASDSGEPAGNDARRGLSDQAYRMLVNAVSGQAIFLLDADGRVISWNPGAERLKGYTADEAIGCHLSDFYTPEDRDLGQPALALETARREGRYESEGWRVRRDGSRFWALAMLEAVRDPDGELVGFAKITRDMTARHEAQLALEESERRFRLLVQGVVDYAIFMLDPEGIITNWNTGAARMKGYAAEEIIGQHFSRFYTPEDRAAGLPQRALQQARDRGAFHAEGWRLRKDGTAFWASVVIDAIRDEEGRLLGFAKVTRDMTERHEAQRSLEAMREQLIQAQKLEALGQLTGGIAHDFNNILQAIMGGVALALPLAGENARLAAILAEMRNAATRGAALTGQLLAFSRRAPPRLEVIDTALHLRQATGLFTHALRHDIHIESRLDGPDAEDLWAVRSDAAQFELALLNVAVNARDAMPHGGTLTISARNVVLRGEPEGLRGRFVAITLADTGAGIPREVMARVFEPFFTTKPAGKGTGLGLSHVYGFARQGGGTVTIESEPGRGTAVTFLLPAAEEGEQPGEAAAPLAPAAAATGGGARILVVDDDLVVGRLAAEMLAGAGYRAAAVETPEEGLERLRDEHFDAVLTDVLMPGTMGGIEFGRELRRRWPEMPVLLTTGYIGRPEADRHEFPVLYKPFATSELVRALWELLADPRGAARAAARQA